MQPWTTVSSVTELKNLSLGKQIIIYLSLVEFFNVAYNFCETTLKAFNTHMLLKYELDNENHIPWIYIYWKEC